MNKNMTIRSSIYLCQCSMHVPLAGTIIPRIPVPTDGDQSKGPDV